MLKLLFSGSAPALLVIAICGASSAQTTPSGSSQTNATHVLDAHISNSRGAPAFQDRYPRYQVMPSDILSISFPLIPEILPVTVTVQPDGFVNLPNGVGTMFVKGYTVPQIVELMTTAYSKTMHNPIVNVDVTNFQPPQFTVNGQVGKPGQYPLRIDTTVSEGIAVAGGFLQTAKSQVFLFHRVNADWVEVKKLNTKRLLKGHNANEDVQLQAGDMIFVPETFIATFRKYIPYGFGLGSAVGFNGTTLLNQ